MAEETPAGSQLERWIRSGASIVAPATVLSALMFYFGYVSARSQYEYFGLDVDAIGLSTQDYIMRSPGPLLVPMLVLALLGLGIQTVYTATRRRAEAALDDPGAGADSAPRTAARNRQLIRLGRLARGCAILGTTVLGCAVVLLFLYSLVRDWAYYDLATPVLIVLGGALIAYGSRVRELCQGPRNDEHSATLLRRTSRAFLYILIAAGIFWTTATVAQWSGRGRAQDEARNLSLLPSVILDTKERLYLNSPGIDETALDTAEGQTFHYRYRHLRLLIHGHDRMFLVPDEWSASDSTLIVPMDGSVRVQFQFKNQPP